MPEPQSKIVSIRRGPSREPGSKLFFGDNLKVLRESIGDESVDLIYLDPPFNSQATYNVLFKATSGERSKAQIEAFEDTWHWNDSAEVAFDEVLKSGNADVAEILRSLRSFLKENDMMAYLTMMAVRMLELHRVLKATGSLYLHCDPTASHYLKILLDGVFRHEQFRNEVIWKRTSAHSSAKRYGPVHDTLLFYAKSKEYVWNELFQPYDENYLAEFYTHVDKDGRRWSRSDLTGAGIRHGETGQTWRKINITAKGRHWAYPPSVLEEMDAEGRIHWPVKSGGMPRLKSYLDEQPGVPLQDVWSDIRPMHNLSDERLGYPTQKPLALLERVISASSNEGDLVLDPFCGCGTAIEAAQRLKRRWIGIDITHLAISLIEKRLKDGFPGVSYEVDGTPKDLEGAIALARYDKYQFQWWAVSLVNAIPYGGKKKGADSGIDGLIYFQQDLKQTGKIVVSVKSGDNIGVAMVRDLGHVIEREKAAMGFFVTLARPSRPMIAEAATMGFYESPLNGARFPKLQILTIEGLLDRTERPEHPQMAVGRAPKQVRAPETSPAQAALPLEDRAVRPDVMDRRMALVCTLVNRLADEPHFGRTKMAKLFYLADVSQKLELDTTYYRQAAGPLDAAALYDAETGLEAFAVEHGYLSVLKTGRKITYRRGPNLLSAYTSAQEILGRKNRTAVNRLIDLFRKLDTDRCEIVATLYACWNDKLLEGEEPTDDSIIDEFLGAWHEKKQRFPRSQLARAIDWMRKNGLVPTGKGSHTKVRARGQRI